MRLIDLLLLGFQGFNLGPDFRRLWYMNRVDAPELREVRIVGTREDLNPFLPLRSYVSGDGLKFLGCEPIQQSWVS